MFFAKILILCTVCLLVSTKAQGHGAVGAPKTLEGEDLARAQQTLESSLTKLATGEGPHYRISKIISATSQVVAGSKHVYSVELINGDGDTKLCTVEIWSRSWVKNGVEVTFRCANEPELVLSHSA